MIADNDPVEQEKTAKFNALLSNAVIFHNALDIAEIVRQLQVGGWGIGPEDLAQVSPYLTEHIRRFGEYPTHELGDEPDAYARAWTSTSPLCAATSQRPRVSRRPRESVSRVGGRHLPLHLVGRDLHVSMGS